MDKQQCAQAVKCELEEMRALIPRIGTPRSKRVQQNKLVCERLPTLRNSTIVVLALYDKHNLAFIELELRLQRKQFQVAQLIELLFALSCLHYTARVQHFFSLAASKLQEAGHTAPYDQLLEQYWAYEQHLATSDLLARVIKKHPDYPGHMTRPT